MNYLAHVFLSCHSKEAVAGAMLGDFVKGNAVENYPPPVRDAILLHRAIDKFTDNHPLHRMSCALVSPERRRFAAVLADVFYDHFLARHWPRYSTMVLREFTAGIYAVLLPQRASFPERLQRILPRMAADDWLASYAEIESVDAALNGIARRFRRFPRAQVLTTAIVELTDHYTDFEGHFLAFFPELQRFVVAQQDGATDTGGSLDIRSAASRQ